MYVFDGSRSFVLSESEASESSDSYAHAFRIVESGTGWLADGRSREPLRRGDCVLLRPGSGLALLPEDGHGPPAQPLAVLEIRFDYLEEIEAEDGAEPRAGERRFARAQAPLPVSGRLPAAGAREAAALAQRLHAAARRADAAPELPAGGEAPAVLFQQLMQLLLGLRPALPADAEESAVSRTVQYMHRHYGEELTRDRLASVAGLSPWYYSGLFRRETGLSPMNYLTELRLRRAREQLILGRDGVREISEACGFKDETYFRRRFKAASGVTPLAFARAPRERIADMSYAYTPHLLALDIMPCAAMIDARRELHRRPYHGRIDVHLRRERAMTPEVWAHNLERLRAAAPDLILCDDGKETPAYGGELERIAPCVYIPWRTLDWRSQFRLLSAYIRREREAELWLERYDEQTAETRARLERIVGGETLLLLRVTDDQLAVYGLRNGGGVLYGDLGLACPYEAAEIKIEQFVDPAFLAACDPDRILLIVDGSAESEAHAQRLRRSDEWRSLRAVRRNAVVSVSEMPWLEYSPLAHAWIVRHLPDLLGANAD